MKFKSCAVLLLVLIPVLSTGCVSNEGSGSASSAKVDDVGTTVGDTVSSTNQVEPSDSTTELNIAGGNDPEDGLMPNVLCMTLQEAQDEIQDHGVFFSRSEDATGQNRMQLMDSNWLVVGQSPAVGSPIGEGDAVLRVVKIGEPTGGVC